MRVRFTLLILFVLIVLFLALPRRAASVPDPQAPAKPNPEAIARSKKLYSFDCAMCHGENGDGKGDMAADFPGKIKDWTNPDSLKTFTDDQLFNIIRDGKNDMPPEGKRAKPDEIRGLVNLIRSFSAK